jgi:hypothetical protein
VRIRLPFQQGFSRHKAWVLLESPFVVWDFVFDFRGQVLDCIVVSHVVANAQFPVNPGLELRESKFLVSKLNKSFFIAFEEQLLYLSGLLQFFVTKQSD